MSQFADLDPFAARRAKLDAWRDFGGNPYPASVPDHVRVEEARMMQEGLVVGVAGRLKSLRGQGALFFADIHDETGKIQILFKKDGLSEELFQRLELLDLGDFIHVRGSLFVTKRGELTVEVQEWTLLSKALRPMPDQWKGLQDDEARQRQRYAELMVNEYSFEKFKKRSELVAAVRRFLHGEAFMEVETAVLEHIPGGADAEPFVTHHNALDTEFYLRISLELQLKRLIVGGYDRVFEIGKVFRNEGMSTQHLQEFTMLEFYWAYASYRELSQFVERMYRQVIQEVFGTLKIPRRDIVLDFEADWKRVRYTDLFKDYVGIDILSCDDGVIIDSIIRHNLKTGGGAAQTQSAEALQALGRGRLLDMLYKKMIRPHLIQPHILLDFPIEFSPLAKKKDDQPKLTERMVVVIDGVEVGNGFSELNDPIDQKERLLSQEKLREAGDAEAQRYDADFIRALEYGMPPTTGFGVGIDRLFALLFDVDSIRDTVLFPAMRPEKNEE